MEEQIEVLDIETPWNEVLSAKYKRSYAYITISERMPKLLSNISEYLTQYEDDIVNQFGSKARQDLVNARFGLTLLVKQIQHDNPLLPLLTMDRDVPLWNNYIWQQQLQNHLGQPCWFHSSWLFVECYFFRSIHQVFQNTLCLASLDPFASMKMEELENSKAKMISGAADLLSMFNGDQTETEIHKHFIRLLKHSLWGNQYDLSKPVMNSDSQHADSCEARDKCILVDDSEHVWETLKMRKEEHNIVNIVSDNAGYELFCDLCLADFILTFNMADTIIFHIKAIPWFISDAVFADFMHLLNLMVESHEPLLKDLYARWKDYVYEAKWIIKDEMFWTLPHVYNEMQNTDLSLYTQLNQCKLVIFKGDVNYRKLLAETRHIPSESFSSALKGFHPASLVSLRTVKCEIICGITKELAEKLSSEEPNWMLTGKYAVIQFDGKLLIH